MSVYGVFQHTAISYNSCHIRSASAPLETDLHQWALQIQPKDLWSKVFLNSRGYPRPTIFARLLDRCWVLLSRSMMSLVGADRTARLRSDSGLLAKVAPPSRRRHRESAPPHLRLAKSLKLRLRTNPLGLGKSRSAVSNQAHA